jgi:cytochrome bd-type quinol oxidase subunit 2
MQGHVIILALLSAINPTMLTAVALILSRPKPKGSLIAFLAGGFLVSVLFGVAALTILHGVSVGKGHSVHISTTVEIVVGLLSLGAAALLPAVVPKVEHRAALHSERKKAKHPDDDQPSRLERMLEKASAPMAFLIGIAFNMPGACYLVSIAELADNRPDFAVWFPLILLFNVIMFLPGEIPLVLYLRNPEGVESRVHGAQVWLRRHAFMLARVMFIVVGVYLLLRAFLGH